MYPDLNWCSDLWPRRNFPPDELPQTSPTLLCSAAQLHQRRSPEHILHKEQLSLRAGASDFRNTWTEFKNILFF